MNGHQVGDVALAHVVVKEATRYGVVAHNVKTYRVELLERVDDGWRCKTTGEKQEHEFTLEFGDEAPCLSDGIL